MSEHTPGPWKASPKARDAVIADTCPESCESWYEHDDGFNLRAYGGYLIAESIAPENRSLISAAPDLLAACEAALALLEDATELVPDGVPFENGPVIELLEAAIAKAQGERRAEGRS